MVLSSERVLLVRTVLLLIVTVISVSELNSTNFSTALSSCEEGWAKIFKSRGMQSGEFFKTSDAKFFCDSPRMQPNCTGLTVSKITVGPNCTINNVAFSNKVFLTVINTSAPKAWNASGVVKLVKGTMTYNVTDLSPFILASQNSQLRSYSSPNWNTDSSSNDERRSTVQLAGASNSDLFQSSSHNLSYDLGACKQVSVEQVVLWSIQQNTLALDASFGAWDSAYTALCPYTSQCQINLQDSSASTCSSSIQLSKWYYSNAYVSCDDILYSNDGDYAPVQTIYLTAGNIGLNLLPTIFTLISLWRTDLWMKGPEPDGLVRPVKPSWEAVGSRELKTACTMSAYAVMEMAGVPEFSGGLALKIVALALHTLHAILFSVVLGWAVPDLIRWESEVLRTFSGYQVSLGIA